MKQRIDELRELLGDAVAQTVDVEEAPNPKSTQALLTLCRRAASKAMGIHLEALKVPEPKQGD